MSSLFRILITLFVIIGSAGFIIFQLLSSFTGIGSLRRRIQRDFKKLRKLTEEYSIGLIPIDLNELKLLSASPICKVKKRSRYLVSRGYLSTIYQEPLFAFAIKKYKRKERALMLCKSTENEYRFYREGDKTKIFKNDTYKGYVDGSDRLFTEVDHESARIESHFGNKYAAVYSGEEDIAHLNMPAGGGYGANDRAFSMFHEFREGNNEELIFLSLYHLLLK